MIRREDLVPIGSIIKTHGIRGEVNALLDADLSPDMLRCIMLEIDGLWVPFFISSSRPRGKESWLLTLEGIDSDTKASTITGKEIYGLAAEIPEDASAPEGEGLFPGDLLGWKAKTEGNELGEIVDFDDTTANLLLTIQRENGKQILVPVAEEFITDVNPETKEISFTLPEGIIDLNN